MRSRPILALSLVATMCVPVVAVAGTGRGAARASSAARPSAQRASWKQLLRRLDDRSLPQRRGAGVVRLVETRSGRIKTSLDFERYKKYPVLTVRRAAPDDPPVHQPVVNNPAARHAYNRAYAFLKKRGYARGNTLEYIDMMEVRAGRFDGMPNVLVRTLFSFLGPAYDGHFGPALSHRDVSRMFEGQDAEQALRRFERETAPAQP